MKVLLFGASGHLGKEIANEVKSQYFDLTVVVRSQKKADQFSHLTSNYRIVDSTDAKSLSNICQGFDVVISALGKSVSLNDKSKTTFHDVDLVANSNILNEAQKSGVKKFVYISALHSENYLQLEYFQAHHLFAERLKNSGINYSIIKPPAIFSAFLDLIELAKKGQLITIGLGDKKTNPIYEGDLAKICVDSIKQDNAIIEAGGPELYTRRQLNAIIQQSVYPDKPMRAVPMELIKVLLPVIKLFNKSMFDKMAFFLKVMQHDAIAPQLGKIKFEDYMKSKVETTRK